MAINDREEMNTIFPDTAVEAETQRERVTEQPLITDLRLIEASFPCHQVGAETTRERDTGKAPPTHRLHVWWARRPLTPSRAAILASLLPTDVDSEAFVKGLGIRVLVADVKGMDWVLGEEKLRERVRGTSESLYLEVDEVVVRASEREQEIREESRCQIASLLKKDPTLESDPVLQRWGEESKALPPISIGARLVVTERMGDPAWAKEKMSFSKQHKIRFPGEAYGYSRAFSLPISPVQDNDKKIILDPTAGGGSIPFEALRLGHNVIANELNPVASVILKATLDYPARFGKGLLNDLSEWGDRLLQTVDKALYPFFGLSQSIEALGLALPAGLATLSNKECEQFKREEIVDYLYCRQVTCSHCGGDAPLLNSLWLSKEGEKWGVAVKPQADKSVRFQPYQIEAGHRGPRSEDLDAGTVTRGVGQCVHCQQAIAGEKIKRQARGESEYGRWQDILYCVAAIRLQPKLDKHGQVQRYATGARKGEIKTEKVRYFRAPNETDLQALKDAEAELERRRLDFEMKGLVPNEPFPNGNDMRPVTYGMPTWADMFTPRQLLGHLILIDTLNELKPQILAALGEERGRAVVTYLQFAIDKGVDYNSKQTRWEFTRGIVKGTFGRHDFSLKWTFGEMVFAGPSSGAQWGLSQIIDGYKGLSQLVEPLAPARAGETGIRIIRGSAANIETIEAGTVDAVVMDPPYYDNVQYSELSDFFYVWQKRTLADLYPGWFDEPVTDKAKEAVANPARDGSAKAAKESYEKFMQGIFAESKRVLKPGGIMTLMFTHKSQDAWETLTNALIQTGWNITACLPVESESGHSTHQMNKASAASTIFIACRPTQRAERAPSSWSFGGGVKAKLERAVREGLKDFEQLKLNPVDRMIASWGRALRVYSAHWPVIDGEEEVTPIRAMQEAARVVAEEEVGRLSGGLISVEDLDNESRLAMIALGINGLGEFAFDEGLQLSKSLNVRLQGRNGNYRVSPDTVAYGNESDGQLAAPLAKKGSRLRLLKPEERLPLRLENPQTLWDMLCGLIVTYRTGGVVAARNYLRKHSQAENQALRGLLRVWAKECRDDARRREAMLIDYEL